MPKVELGKRTLAVHLAVWLHERGQRVMLVDCDLQRSSSQWMAEAAPEVRVEVLLSEDELIERAPVFQQDVDIVVAHGLSGLKELTRALLLVCDTAFIPCGPSVLDVRAVSEAIRVVKQAQSIRKGIPEGSVAKFDFWGKIQKSGIRNSTTYRLPNSRKSNFATEPPRAPPR